MGSLLFGSLIQFYWCIIKHLKNTKLYSIEFLRTEIMSDPSNYHRDYSPYGSYSLFQFEGSDVISVLKNSIEYSFVFFNCFLVFKMVNRLKCNKDDIVVILNNLQRLTISICYNFLFTCLILNIEALSETTY